MINNMENKIETNIRVLDSILFCLKFGKNIITDFN